MIDLTPLHDALIKWFENEKEALPWRQTADPYAIWVSEIMLQQTQVTTVIPYYERFLARFPTVEALAAAPVDEVLKLWEGLGYYSRARHLHRAAQMVVEGHGGKLPADLQALQHLPGIGRYTAGAIASFAFGLDAPLLDGNVIRIFSRLFNIPDDITQSRTRRILWEKAEAVLPAGRAARWNEGLMELGRRVCVPRNPLCEGCPVGAYCEAHRQNLQHERPVKAPRKRTPHYDVTAAVIRDEQGRILIAQRLPNRMLGGLWEFPGGKREDGESLPACLQREIREELGIEITVGEQVATVKHAYTHFRITLHVFACQVIAGRPQALECADWVWVEEDGFERYAFPVTDRQIIRVIRAEDGAVALE